MHIMNNVDTYIRIYIYIWVSGPSETRELRKFRIVDVYICIYIDGLIRVYKYMNISIYIYLYIYLYIYMGIVRNSGGT
jgi:hypothetical protein